MSDKTLRDLQEQRAAVQKEIDELSVQARVAEQKRQVRIAKLKSFDDVIQHMQEAYERAESESLPAKYMRNEIVEILKEEGKPLPTSEIFRNLLERGIPINGENPMKNVGSHLSLDERFERYSAGIWGLKSWRGKPPKGSPENPSPRNEQRAAGISSFPRVDSEPPMSELSLEQLMQRRRARGA